MPSPSTVKEVQTLNGRLVALNRFLSNHAAKSSPFIETLKNYLKKSNLRWTAEAEEAFKQMKQCLMNMPTLTAPFPGEPLIMYISATEKAVGAVLLVERKLVQTPIYYVSRVLTDPETRYSTMEKLFLALVYASRRLRMYFQGHHVHVLSDYKLNNVLRRPELSGRLAKWAIELGKHTITYKTRPTVKGQVLADFITKVPSNKMDECRMDEEPARAADNQKTWSLFTDGASNDDGAVAGLRLISPDKQEYTYAIRLDFKSTNNETEYEALLAGLRIADKLGARNLDAHVDSMLVAGQINGIYDAKDATMIQYLEQAKELMR